MTWIDWYNSLAKPSWTPAPSTISLIWTILYPIIVVSFGFIFIQALWGKVGPSVLRSANRRNGPSLALVRLAAFPTGLLALGQS